jgi:hypothetical protein
VIFCAICTSDVGPFVTRPIGKDDALVRVCAACDDDPPRAVFGPERPYEGAGPAMGRQEMSLALRRFAGDERYEADNRKHITFGKSPGRALPATELDWRVYQRETARRHRTGSMVRKKP